MVRDPTDCYYVSEAFSRACLPWREKDLYNPDFVAFAPLLLLLRLHVYGGTGIRFRKPQLKGVKLSVGLSHY